MWASMYPMIIEIEISNQNSDAEITVCRVNLRRVTYGNCYSCHWKNCGGRDEIHLDHLGQGYRELEREEGRLVARAPTWKTPISPIAIRS